MKIYHYDWNLSARQKLLRRWKFITIIKIYHWNENVSLWWKIITVMKINHSAEIFLLNIMKIVYFDENFLLWRQFIIKMEIYYCDNWGENILLWCKFLTVLHYKRNKNEITFLETIVVWCIITWMTKNFFWSIILLCMFLAYYKVEFQNVALQLYGVGGYHCHWIT